MRLSLARGLGLILLVSCLPGPLRGNDPTLQRVAELINQLGDAAFARREAASKGLEAVGEQALPALRTAAADNPDLEIRRRARQAIRAIMLGCRKSKSTGLEMALIDMGGFQMGSAKGESGRRPDELAHPVAISRPYLLGVYEVTQSEFERVMKTRPSWFSAAGGGKDKVVGLDTSRFPVEQASWYDAVEFCNRLSKQDGYEPYYRLDDVQRAGEAVQRARVTIAGGNGYRLPTEAEWEYACRAGTIRAFHFGVQNTGREANLKPGPATGYGSPRKWPTLDRTAKVGSYPPNDWGLYDMHGNAAEWCWDWYGKDYAPAPAADPHGPASGTHRVVRGGSWLVNEGSCRSASRAFHPPDERNYVAGFRVARTP